MSENIIKVPIQINGGDNIPSSLLNRELYIKSDGRLYYGKSNETTSGIIAGNSDSVGSVGNTSSIYINSTGTGTFKLGNAISNTDPIYGGNSNILQGMESSAAWTAYLTFLTNNVYDSSDKPISQNPTYAINSLMYFNLCNSYLYNCLLHNPSLARVQILTLSGNQTYGTTLPSTGKVGQVFFKI